jgi:hypothetical protein
LKLADLEPKDVVRLRKIWQSLRDGFTVPADWFAGASIDPIEGADVANMSSNVPPGPANQAPKAQAGVKGGGMGRQATPREEQEPSDATRPDPLDDDQKRLAAAAVKLKERNMRSVNHGTQEFEKRLLAISTVASVKDVDAATLAAANRWMEIADQRLTLLDKGSKAISTDVTRRTNELALLELIVLRAQFAEEGALRERLDELAQADWKEIAKLSYLQFRDLVAACDKMVGEVKPDWFESVRFGPEVTK